MAKINGAPMPPAPTSPKTDASRMFTSKRYSTAEAKAAHDRLESVYNPYVDFDGVRAQAALEAGRLLSWMQ